MDREYVPVRVKVEKGITGIMWMLQIVNIATTTL